MINSIRKQTVQGMAKFVEESRHLVEGQQGRLVATWRSKVTYNGDHRMNKVAFLIDLLLAVTAHPSTATLAGTRMHIHIQNTYVTAICLLHFPGCSLWMVNRHIVALLKLQSIQLIGHHKDAVTHTAHLKIPTDFSLIQIVLGLTHLFGIVTPIPKSQIKVVRSEEHTSELQSRPHLVCRLLLEKKKKKTKKKK